MGPNITPGRLRPAPGQRPRLGVGRSPRCGVRGCHPGKFLKTQILNPAFWWLLRSLVGSRGRVYSSKQACQGLNQFQNFNYSAVVASLVVRKKQSIHLCCVVAVYHRTNNSINFLFFFENYGQKVGGPIHCWSPNVKVGDQSPPAPVPTVVAPMFRQRDVNCSRLAVERRWNRTCKPTCACMGCRTES